MNCSEYLVDYLIEHGVTDVFGYAGGYIVSFMDALQRRDEIKVHVCYHEQGCAFAAVGYARMTGKPGVFFTTSGPGAVNAMGGVADAWFDGIPLIGICGSIATTDRRIDNEIRQNGFQEMDIVALSSSITKFSGSPKMADEMPELVEKAYRLATTDRKGGVIIDFPIDIQKAGLDCR